MKHITDVSELIPGKQYWLRDKKTRNSCYLSELKTVDGNHYFEENPRVLAMPDNNQAMECWEIFGPRPWRAGSHALVQPPNFNVLLAESQGKNK